MKMLLSLLFLLACGLTACGPGLLGSNKGGSTSSGYPYTFSAELSLVEGLEDEVDIADGDEVNYKLVAYLVVAGEGEEIARLPINLKRNGDTDFASYASVELNGGKGNFSGLVEVPSEFNDAHDAFQIELWLVDQSGNMLLSKLMNVESAVNSTSKLSTKDLRSTSAADIGNVAINLTSTICTSSSIAVTLGAESAKFVCDVDVVTAIVSSVVNSLSSDLSVSQLTGQQLAQAAQAILYYNFKTNAGGIRDLIASSELGTSGFESRYVNAVPWLPTALNSDSGLSYFTNATQLRNTLTEMYPRVPIEFDDTDSSDKIGGKISLPNLNNERSDNGEAGRCLYREYFWSPPSWVAQIGGLPDCSGSYVAYFGGESRDSAKGTLIGNVPLTEMTKNLVARGYGNYFEYKDWNIRTWSYTIPSGTSVPPGASRIWWIHKNAAGSETGYVGSVSIVNKMSVPSARLEFTNGSRYDLDTDQGAAQDTVVLTVKNKGTAAAVLGTISDAGLGLDSPFSLDSATCTTGQTLAANETCTLTIALSSNTAGDYEGALTLFYDDGAQSQDVGVGVTFGGYVRLVREANLQISGALNTTAGIGQSSTITVTVTNTGNRTATLSVLNDVNLGLAAPFSYVAGGTCGSGGTLAANASCTVLVSFAPTTAGAASDTLTIAYSKPASATATAAISGTGTVAVLAISPSGTLGFDSTSVGDTDDLTVTLTNTGTATATLGTLNDTNLGLAAPFSYVAGGTCASGGTLAANASCTVLLRFAPTSAVVSTDTLEIPYNNGVAQTTTSRAVSGQGTQNLGELAASIGNSYTFVGDGGFGPVVGSAVISLTFVNQGGGSASGLVLTPMGTFSSELTLENDTCTGATIAASGSCSVDVRWTPSGGEQFMSDELLHIEYNDGTTTQTLDTVNFGGFAGI